MSTTGWRRGRIGGTTGAPAAGRVAVVTAVVMAVAMALAGGGLSGVASAAPGSAPATTPAPATAPSAPSAPGHFAQAAWPCVAEFPSVTPGGMLIRNSVGGAPRVFTYVEGQLGYRPRAVVFLGQAGDIATNATVYAALSPAGVLEKVRVARAVRSGRTKVTWDRQVLSTRFQGVRLLAGTFDALAAAGGSLYAVTRAGALNRYTLAGTGTGTGTGTGITGTAVVAATGWQDVTTLSFSWAGRVGRREGDVLLGVTGRDGALFEQFVPVDAPADSSRHQLGRRGWNRWSRIYRTECPQGQGGLLGVTPRGTGRFYNDANAHELVGADIVNAGALPIRIVGTPY